MRSGTNVRTAIELYGERDGLCKQQLRLFDGDENRVQPDEKEYECFFTNTANQALVGMEI